MKRAFILTALIGLVASQAFGQIMIGASGALYLDQTDMDALTADGLFGAFEDGTNVWYGGFVELAGRHTGIGMSFNFTEPYELMATDFQTYDYNTYDASLYVSYHVFGSTAFLDPLVEFGMGGFFVDTDSPDYELTNGLAAASIYCYPAIGLGVNIGPLGVFMKLATYFAMPGEVTVEDDYGNEWPVYEYGQIPEFRWTLGAKLILGR